MELTKSEKSRASELIREGMMRQFERTLQQADQILNDWKTSKGDPQEAYRALYQYLYRAEKDIAGRYNGLKNQELLFVLVQQIQEGLVPEQALSGFSEETQKWMFRFL